MPHLIHVRRVRATRTGLYSLAPLTEPSGGLALPERAGIRSGQGILGGNKNSVMAKVR